MRNNQTKDPIGSIHFTTKRLIIREFSQNDLEALLTYEKQPGMLQFEHGIPDDDTAKKYLNNAIQCAREVPRTRYHLAINISPNNEVIGRVSLTRQNPSIDEWEIGWSVRMDYWGKGYATEAAYQMLEFAFQNLHAHRLVAFCHADNISSAKVMEKLSMKREGHLRQTRWFNERWADEYVYAILDAEFTGDDC